MRGFEVRALTEDDLPAVRALWSTVEGLGHGPGDEPHELARFLQRNPGLSTIAIDGPVVVAAALCGHDGRRGIVYRLAVAPAARRRGIARAVVERCLAGLRAEGIPRCMLFILETNAAAREFWASVGGEQRRELGLWSIDLSP